MSNCGVNALIENYVSHIETKKFIFLHAFEFDNFLIKKSRKFLQNETPLT